MLATIAIGLLEAVSRINAGALHPEMAPRLLFWARHCAQALVVLFSSAATPLASISGCNPNGRVHFSKLFLFI